MTQRPDNPWLLVTDVDNTLVGNNDALEDFVQMCSSSKSLTPALNSSRPCADVRLTLTDLPVAFEPKAIIGAMGTEIEIDGHLVEEWTQQFAGWERARFDELLGALGFEAHAPNLQTPFKVSYAVPQDDHQRVEEAILAHAHDARIVKSGVSDFDILPPGAGKGTATVFLARRLGFSLDRLIVAGDSANDIDMFKAADKGIVVGNADAGLKDAVDPSRVCFARAGFAAGLIEGLGYWNVPIKNSQS